MQLRWTALWEPREVGVKMEEWDLITRWMWSIIDPGMRCVREDGVITGTQIYLFLLNLHRDQATKLLPKWNEKRSSYLRNNCEAAGGGVLSGQTDMMWQTLLVASTQWYATKKANHGCERGSKEWHSLMPSFTPFYKHIVYVHKFSPTITTNDCLGYASKGQMEVKGTCTPACQCEHLPVNHWEMMWALWPSCFICKELFYANVSGQRQTQHSLVAPRLRCTKGRRIKQNIKTEWKLLNEKTTGFGTCDISLPPVPFITQMLG